MAASDQSIYFLVLLGFLLMVLMSAFIIFMVFAHRQRQIRAKEKLTAIKLEFEKTLLDVEKEIREETLSFVGRELHDNIGQLLSLAKLNLASNKPEKIQTGKNLLNDIIQEVRGLSKVLNLDWVEGYSLETFVQKELEKLEQAEFCKTTFQTEIQELILTKEEKIILIRVIQECINNAIKHASPSLIEVIIRREKEINCIQLRDNGKGFTVNVEKTGSGLVNLKKRMETIGGDFQLTSALGKGTMVKLYLPN
jgi:two-component system, NarL family, sensor kinase